jgi:hypothetical protein
MKTGISRRNFFSDLASDAFAAVRKAWTPLSSLGESQSPKQESQTLGSQAVVLGRFSDCVPGSQFTFDSKRGLITLVSDGEGIRASFLDSQECQRFLVLSVDRYGRVSARLDQLSTPNEFLSHITGEMKHRELNYEENQL